MSPIKINISLLAHIAADSELQGRYGVQGHVFCNTIGYFKQYLQRIRVTDPTLIKLVHEVEKLHTTSNELATMASNQCSEAEVSEYANNIAQQIKSLAPNQAVILPGGWLSYTQPGHAMIYHFKNENNQLRFYIYNAGAGIHYHEKISGTNNERYYATKVYTMPANVDVTMLSRLILRLVKAQMPHLHTTAFDAKTLYLQNIDEIIPFIIDLTTTQPVLAQNLFEEMLTTSGQISGTCSQRSIHQMLKHYFPTLAAYRRFIVAFKLYAIQDYLNQYAHGVISEPIQALIAEAIINTIKICNLPDLYLNEAEKENHLNSLYELQDRLQKLSPEAPQAPKHNQQQASNYKIIDNGPPAKPFNATQQPALQHMDVTLERLDTTNTAWLDQFEAIQKHCENIKKSDALWVIQQIEQVFLDLPIPQAFTDNHPVYLPIITDKKQFDRLTNILYQYQQILERCCHSQFGNNQFVPQIITHFSLLAIHDYCHRLYTAYYRQPDFSDFFAEKIKNFLNAYRHSPYMGSYQGNIDHRFFELSRLYKTTENNSHHAHFDKHIITCYNQLLACFPEAHQALKTHYQPPANQKLADYLVRHQACDLYTLSQAFDKDGKPKNGSFLQGPPFIALTQAILKQYQYECAILRAFKPIMSAEDPLSLVFKFEFTQAPCESFRFCSTLGTQLGVPEASLNITKNQYVIQNPEVLSVIRYETPKRLFIICPKKSSNNIQLTPNDPDRSRDVMHKKNLFYRDLFHLRASQQHQASLTIDYFQDALHHLKDSDLQQYVEAMLFEPGVLSKTLTHDKTFLMRFDRFIQSGLKTFATKHHELTQTSLFFVRLSFYVNRLIAENDFGMYHPRLIADYHRINDLLLTNSNTQILAGLHHHRFLLLVALHEQNQPLTQTDIERGLISYFYLQAYLDTEYVMDRRTQAELHFKQRRFKALLQQRIAEISEETLTRLVQHLYPKSKQWTITKQSNTRYQVKNTTENSTVYELDVMEGAIYQHGKRQSAIPLWLYHSKLFNYFHLERQTSCALSDNGQVVEFEQPDGVKLRFSKALYDYQVQKEFIFQGKKNWYELFPLSAQQKYQLQLYHQPLEHNLPLALQDGTMSAWKACDANNRIMLLTENNTIAYYQTGDSVLLQAVPAHTPYTPSRIAEPFENADFVISTQGTNAEIYFKRYGFRLIEHAGQYIHQKHPSLIYEPSIHFPIPGVAALGLKKIIEKNGCTHEQHYFMVPVQPFIRAKKNVPSGNFYPFEHDIAGKVAKTRLSQYWEERRIPEAEQPVWYYENTCRSIIFPVVNDQPKPDKAADALYLVYLYLAAQAPQKAWDMLASIQQKFPLTGTYEELTAIDLIINGLPVVLDDSDNEATRETPVYQACQLQTLALITDYLAHDKTFALPETKEMDDSTANGAYELILIQRAHTLLNHLDHTVQTKLNRYFNIERHLAKNFELSEASLTSLLSYLASQRTVLHGAIGYRQLTKTLTPLAQELVFLESHIALLQQGQGASPLIPLSLAAAQKRIEAIHQEVAKKTAVMKQRTTIHLGAVNLTLPKQVLLRLDKLNRYSASAYQKWRNDLNDFKYFWTFQPDGAIEKLSPDISEDDVFVYFPYYFKIACDTKTNESDALQLFCKNYLIAHRHTPLNEQTTSIPTLVNILYRALHYPNKSLLKQTPLSFDNLVSLLTNSPGIPTLQCYQTQDAYTETLADAPSIFQSILNQIPKPEPRLQSTKTDDRLQASMDGFITNSLLRPFYEAFLDCDRQYQGEVADILSKLPQKPTIDELHRAEEAVGIIQLESFNKKQGASLLLKDATVRQALKQKIRILADEWQVITQAALNDLVLLATEKPDNPTDTKSIEIARRTRQQSPPSEKLLLDLYFLASPAAYQAQTGLSRNKIQALYDATHVYVQQKLHYQQILRILNACIDAEKNPSNHQLMMLANTLMSQNLVDSNQEPEIMRFQLEENLLLRPRQMAALKILRSGNPDQPHQFGEWIEKIIMGGGKSKVILPLLAKMKATGLNLVVIEVPRALIKTNHADLNATSQKVFSQKAHIFNFDRTSQSTPAHLQRIYQQLLHIMTERHYLITTGESIQSFRLKYLEILFAKPPLNAPAKTIENWKNQVHFAKKIALLFKQRADVIIDEVHDGLLLKRKLNYAFGEPLPISSEIIELSLSLFSFLRAHILLPQLDPSLSLPEQIQQTEIAFRSGWQTIQDDFPALLIDDPKSPLAHYVNQLCGDDAEKRKNLIAYLRDEAPCDCLAASDNQTMLNAFAFFKAQQKMLPLTLTKRYQEHYGPSQIPVSTEMKKVIAIPYIGNGKPKEQSQFRNPLETINYTMQALYLTGISRSMLIEIIQKWQTAARQEILESNLLTFNQTQIAKTVNKDYLDEIGISFDTLDVTNSALMDTLHQHLQRKHQLIDDILANHVLPEITQECHILSSNALDHADIYHTKQGISGTPSNYQTLHQQLQFNPITSLGSDGFIQALLTQKNTMVQYQPFKQLADYLRDILKQTPNTRAMMDISATFRGYDPDEVARTLADIYHNQLEYVLYFDKTEQLCAISCQNPQAAPIILATSDPDEISERLGGCSPEMRFTYYDQSHTVGTDIKQAPHAHAIALIDERTTLQAFLQGVMRMRGLETGQSISVIAAHQLADSQLESYLEHMRQNEKNQLQQDIFNATIEKIDNLYYNNCMHYVLSQEDPNKQAELAQQFKSFFVQTQQLDLFAQYGAIATKQATRTILEHHAAQAFNHWKSLITEVNISIDEHEAHKLNEAAQAIIHEALPDCAPETEWYKHHGQNQTCETERESQQEQQQQIAQENQEFVFDPEHEPAQEIEWRGYICREFAAGKNHIPSVGGDAITFDPLLSLLPQASSFSEQIFVSNHYQKVFETQTEMVGYFLKPVFVVMFRLHPTTGALSAHIITNQELAAISQFGLPPNIWIVNLKSTYLEGTLPPFLSTPEEQLNPEALQLRQQYDELLEQIQFFSGEMHPLLNQEKPLTWLSQDSDKKLAYFEKHLMPYRQTEAHDLLRMKMRLVKTNQYHEAIQQLPTDKIHQNPTDPTCANVSFAPPIPTTNQTTTSANISFAPSLPTTNQTTTNASNKEKPAENPLPDNSLVKSVQSFIQALQQIKGNRFNPLISQLVNISEQYLAGKKQLDAYKTECAAAIQAYEPQLQAASQRSLSLFEYICELLRKLFHFIDRIMSVFSSKTMADTYTPGARTFLGRNHFFVPPDRNTELGNALHAVELKLG